MAGHVSERISGILQGNYLRGDCYQFFKQSRADLLHWVGLGGVWEGAEGLLPLAKKVS